MYQNGERVMAWVAKIDEVKAIPDADAIEAYRVGGWWVVDRKNAHVVGDLAVYISIDSWIPHDLAPFLSKGQEPKEYNGVKGNRLRTVRLKKQISQGLLLPLTVINPRMDELTEHLGNAEGFNCDELLNIQKYEPPLPACLAGEARGVFPSAVPKTDQERIQNLGEDLQYMADFHFEVTEKLDGSSATFYLDETGDFHVCSRNLDLRDTEGNTFWQIARKYNIKETMIAHSLQGIAIQGEVVGNGIQGNPYKITDQDFFVFDIYDSKLGKYLSSKDRVALAQIMELNHVPVLTAVDYKLTVESLLAAAEGKSVLNPKTEREGLVFKCIEDPSISFKAISNRFLIKNGD